MLQIIVVFYGPGLLFGMQVGNDYRFKAALIAFIINYSCYFSLFQGKFSSFYAFIPSSITLNPHFVTGQFFRFG